jgi:beta-glucosidase
MRRNAQAAVALVVLFLCHLIVAQVPPSHNEVEKRADAILGRMTLEEKLDMIGGVKDFYIRPIPRLGLPALKMSDGPLGVRTWGPTTGYPAGIALAASWDTDMVQRVGSMMGKDARARGVHFILAPGMNIYRAPQCGRNFEYFGEDPYLASRMAVSLINGVQGQGVIATAKHFAANNQEFDRFNISSDVDERTLREIYLPAFEASVKEAKVGAIMDGYNLINGVHMTQHDYLNNQVVKKEWGFDGIIMSDWGSTHDGVAAANGGLDLEMPSAAFMNRATLLLAIKEGKVSIATIDDKIRRILRKAIEFGFLDRGQTDTSFPLYNQEGREAALEAAKSSMVLLKNSGNLLPLDKSKVKTIAVIGPDAYPSFLGGGGSSQVAAFRATSYLEGVSDYLGTSAKVLYAFDNPPLDEVFDTTEFVTTQNGEAGLQGEYFANQDLQGTPVLVRTDKQMNFRWGEGSFAEKGPVDHFSVRWTGAYVAKKSGDYRFYASADDGVRLFIDGKLAIDDWQRHSEKLNTYVAHLEAGKSYTIKLEYMEVVGSASIGFGVIRAEDAVGRESKALAAKADVAIVFVGFDPNSESEGSDRSFQLPSGQDELIRQISSVNKNTIVVLTAGGNVDMAQWLDKVPGLIHAWYSGQEGGTALAQLLFGDFSPSGKLPASFERRWEDNATFNSYYPGKGENRVAYKEGLFVGYRHFDRSETKPLFPFGFGLSYTTFKYSNLTVSPKSAKVNDPVTVTFDVKNTGAREGAEVAQLYVSDTHAGVPRPVKELKGFAKVNLRPGEMKKVTLNLDRRAFAYYDVNNRDWSVAPGQFGILVGSSSETIELNGAVTLTR